MRFKLKIIRYWLQIILTPKFRSRKALEAFQAKRMKRFAKKVLTKSKFYRSYFSNNEFQWNEVPLISKKEFMNSFNEINTQNIKLNEAMEIAINSEKTRDFKSEINEVTVGLSTGTSGKRGLFLVSEDERALWVALVMTRVIKPKLFKKQKVAFFLRANSNLYASVESKLFEFKYFDIFKPLPELLEELNAYQPDILASQPSLLIDIAQAQQEKTIQISPIQVISFAEVLHLNDKKTIESIFKTNIKEVYQCTEGFLGTSCDHGTMHLNEDFIHFDKDWIDEDKFYPIVTDFSRHSQPVVKYKMNDILQVRKIACPCGSKLLGIEKILGRDDDVLILNEKKIYPDLIARKIAIYANNFQKYSITQTASNLLEIGINCPESDWEEIKNIFQSVLGSLFSDFGIKDIEYQFQHNPKRILGNKMRKIKRLKYEN